MDAVEEGEVEAWASSSSSSGQLRKNIRTFTGVATSTAAMLRKDSSVPTGAGRRRLGPKTVARLLRFILFSSALPAILCRGHECEKRVLKSEINRTLCSVIIRLPTQYIVAHVK